MVDTHVKRLSYRLGLTDATDPSRIEQDLVAVIPRKEWIAISHRLIEHGRAVCRAIRPRCEVCELARICPKRGPRTDVVGNCPSLGEAHLRQFRFRRDPYRRSLPLPQGSGAEDPMHIQDIFRDHPTTFSFEFFPPKTDEASEDLFANIARLQPLEPSFVSVTYGAGGSTRERTHELILRIQRETDLTAVSHLTCVCHTEADLVVDPGALRRLGRREHPRSWRRPAQEPGRLRSGEGRLPERRGARAVHPVALRPDPAREASASASRGSPRATRARPTG